MTLLKDFAAPLNTIPRGFYVVCMVFGKFDFTNIYRVCWEETVEDGELETQQRPATAPMLVNFKTSEVVTTDDNGLVLSSVSLEGLRRLYEHEYTALGASGYPSGMQEPSSLFNNLEDSEKEVQRIVELFGGPNRKPLFKSTGYELRSVQEGAEKVDEELATTYNFDIETEREEFYKKHSMPLRNGNVEFPAPYGKVIIDENSIEHVKVKGRSAKVTLISRYCTILLPSTVHFTLGEQHAS